MKDLQFKRVKYHLLRPCWEKHPGEHSDKVDFRMKCLKSSCQNVDGADVKMGKQLSKNRIDFVGKRQLEIGREVG